MTAKKITKLTPEQEEYLPQHLEKWLAVGRSTEKADRPRAEKAVRDLYVAKGYEPPEYICWVHSPMQGCIAAAILSVMEENQIPEDLPHQLYMSAAAIQTDRLKDAPLLSLWEQGKDKVVDQLHAAAYGQHDYWVGWLAFGHEIGAKLDEDILFPLMELAQSCCWWWPFDKAAVVSERPSFLSIDEQGRLHCEDKAAWEFPDGCAVYAWHGMRVPEDIILHPEEITVQRIDQEQNAELRRILIERYGTDRFLRDAGAKLVHEDERGKLWKRQLDNNDTFAAVQVVCPSTGREYFLPVPPDTERAAQGVAWGWQLSEEEYQPEIET